MRLYLLIFSLVFFAIALYFSLFPGKILTSIGKILNPLFLLFLAILIVVAMLRPSAHIADVTPDASYAAQPFFTGFLGGYNTMDALASLAFGIIVVQVIRDLGVQEPGDIAANTVRAGIFSCLFMGVIYLFVTIVGTQSRGLFAAAENGGTALAQIAQHYLGYPGLVILAATVTLACLKTAVGLITSCAETFSALFPRGPAYRVWAALFAAISFLFANLGLSSIITFSVPVLMFLYPLSITLILLALCGKLFHHDRAVYNWVIGCTLGRLGLRSAALSARYASRGLPSGRPAGRCGRRSAAFRGGAWLDLPDPSRSRHRPHRPFREKAPHKLNLEKPHPPSWMRFYLFCSDLGEQRLRAAQSVDRRGCDAPGIARRPRRRDRGPAAD